MCGVERDRHDRPGRCHLDGGDLSENNHGPQLCRSTAVTRARLPVPGYSRADPRPCTMAAKVARGAIARLITIVSKSRTRAPNGLDGRRRPDLRRPFRRYWEAGLLLFASTRTRGIRRRRNSAEHGPARWHDVCNRVLTRYPNRETHAYSSSLSSPYSFSRRRRSMRDVTAHRFGRSRTSLSLRPNQCVPERRARYHVSGHERPQHRRTEPGRSRHPSAVAPSRLGQHRFDPQDPRSPRGTRAPGTSSLGKGEEHGDPTTRFIWSRPCANERFPPSVRARKGL
jgi:hypothetical protein